MEWEWWQIVLVTIGVLVAVKFLALLIIGRGSLARLGLATSVFCRVLADPGSVGRAQALLNPPPPPPPPQNPPARRGAC